MSLPLITIGITCYNAVDTIRRAVDSAFDQDWPNVEVIAVDDGSSDCSYDVLQELSQLHGGFRLVRHVANKGYAGALNTIIEAAKGEFIAIFDDDDKSSPERLQEQWRRIINYEEAKQCDLVLCYANRNIVGKHGSKSHVAHAIGRRPQEPRGVAVADYLFGHERNPSFVWGVFGSCTLMARRRTFLTVGHFDETFRRCAEWDMAVRAAFLGAHFIAVDSPVVTQFVTDGADKSGVIPLQSMLHLRRKHRDYLKRKKVYWACLAIAHSRFHGARGRAWRSRTYRALAYLSSPAYFMNLLRAKVQ